MYVIESSFESKSVAYLLTSSIDMIVYLSVRRLLKKILTRVQRSREENVPEEIESFEFVPFRFVDEILLSIAKCKSALLNERMRERGSERV